MKNKFVVLIIVLSLVFFPGGLFGKTRKHGARLHVFGKDGHEQEGELIGVKNSSLVLYHSDINFTVDIKELKMIRVLKKSKAAQDALIGFVIGAVAGGVGGAIYFSGDSNDEWTNFFKILLTMLASAGGGGAGLLTGLVVGSIQGIDETIQIEGRSDDEIDLILQKLRRMARVPEYR
jgi:hypothetical protein